jgi:iron complex transport system substrate-binding protein
MKVVFFVSNNSFPRIFILLFILVLLVSGCSSKEKPVTENVTEAPTSTVESQAPTATRIVKHLNGETPIIGEPSKLAVLDYRLADSMLALGMKPYAMNSYLGDVNLEYVDGNPLEGVKNLGDDLNLEAVLQAEPDLIIAREGAAKVYDDLKKIAPTIILDESDDWRVDFLNFADVLDKKEQADTWLKQYADKAAAAQTEILSKIGKGKTAIVLRILQKEYRIYGPSRQLGGILYRDLGFEAEANVKVIKKQQAISMEKLPDFDADYIFVQVGNPIKGGDKEAEKKFEELKISALWKNLKAVENNHIILMPYWTLRDFPIINEKAMELVRQNVLNN